jgi:hypothetical protein
MSGRNSLFVLLAVLVSVFSGCGSPTAHDAFVQTDTVNIESHNLENLDMRDSISLLFSSPVDISLFHRDSIAIYRGWQNEELLLSVEWDQSGRRLSIAPFEGVWNPAIPYRIHIGELAFLPNKRLTGSAFSRYYEFSVFAGGELGPVASLRFRNGEKAHEIIDYNTSSIVLSWASAENAAYYSIYAKSAQDDAWSKILDEVIDTSARINTRGCFIEGGSVRCKVIAHNSVSRTEPASAPTIQIQDNASPFVKIQGVLSLDGFDNSSSSREKVLYFPVYNVFSEPVDTSGHPRISIDSDNAISKARGPGGPISYEWQWISTSEGVVSFKVNASHNAASRFIVLDFSHLSDLAGNQFGQDGKESRIVCVTRE